MSEWVSEYVSESVSRACITESHWSGAHTFSGSTSKSADAFCMHTTDTHAHTHTHTHSLTHSHTHSLTHTHTHSHTPFPEWSHIGAANSKDITKMFAQFGDWCPPPPARRVGGCACVRVCVSE